MTEGNRRVVQVALHLPLVGTFSYGVPEEMETPSPGCRVRVPFGRRTLVGFVVEDPEAKPPESLKPVQQLLDQTPLLPRDVLDLTRWIADYYQVSWGMVLHCSYPTGLDPVSRRRYALTAAGAEPRADGLGPLRECLARGPRPLSSIHDALGPPADALLHQALREGLTVQEEAWSSVRRRAGQDRVCLLLSAEEAAARAADPGTPPFHRKALQARLGFEERGFPRVAEVAGRARVPQFALSEMAEAGLVELFSLIPSHLSGMPSPHLLNDAQRVAVEEIEGSLLRREGAVFLLFGVTGSGKTEVYMRLIERSLDLGGSALYLVPEISLASFLARRLMERFGSALAILHSSMTEHERIRQWRRALRGEAHVVIGPRSALFAPLPDLRVILVDEEHDASYKQQESPRYHARDMAIMRGSILSVPVVLGSATPSVESYYNATEGKKYRLLALPSRAGGAELPPVEIVDMRREYSETGGRSTLSRSLHSAMAETLSAGHQCVILRNRLGFATFVLCRECGKTMQCPDCSVALTHHRKAGLLKCHFCGSRHPIPVACPHCGGEFLQFLGEGTERVEGALEEVFPSARIGRMDRERIKTGRDYDALWRDFERGAIDILAGTQMVAKGHDIPNVTLVGILSADFLLGMPDFRSAERTFQLITQAAGRAGRGAKAGRVILQSFHPDHYAVQAASAHDFLTFYEKDIRYRSIVGYPPISALARVELRHADPSKADSLANRAAALLRDELSGGARLLGPVEAPIPKLEGKYRRQILLKAQSRNALRAALGALLRSDFGRRNIGKALEAEIDPGSLL